MPPFIQDVIAGQGTAARELIQEVGALDVLLVPCGGGGLLSGSAIAARALSPNCRVIGVEPAAGDDGVRSFRTRQLQRVENPRTVADGARTPSLGALTLPLVLEYVADMAAVTDEALLRAMFYLWERTKLMVEPTGALGAAALLEGPLPPAAAGAERIGVILSGGNVDLSQVASWMEISNWLLLCQQPAAGGFQLALLLRRLRWQVQIATLERIDDHRRNGETRKPLVIGGNDVPRRKARARLR